MRLRRLGDAIELPPTLVSIHARRAHLATSFLMSILPDDEEGVKVGEGMKPGSPFANAIATPAAASAAF
jgi:hypothetical protein